MTAKPLTAIFSPFRSIKKEPLEDEKRPFWAKRKKGQTLVLEPGSFQLPSCPAKALERGLRRIKIHLLRSCKAGGLGVITSPAGFSDTLRNSVSGPLKVALCCIKHVHLRGRWAGPCVRCHFKHGWFSWAYALHLRSRLSSWSQKDKRQPLSTESSVQATVFVTFYKPCVLLDLHMYLSPFSYSPSLWLHVQ